MHETAWKQLIRILLSGWFLLSFIISFSNADKLDSRNSKLENQQSGEVDPDSRAHKVRAKWKGDKFWAQAAANLTLLESLKTMEAGADKEQTSISEYLPSRRNSKGRQKQNHETSSGKRSTIHRDRERTSLISNGNETSNSTNIKTSTTVTPISRKTTSAASHTTKSNLNKKNKHSSSSNKPKTPRPRVRPKVTLSPKQQLDRATLVADLSQYGQDYYLEYESNEEPAPAPKIQQNATSNSTQINIQFFPKTPVNLLYLLQAYASNMKPIRLESPVTGEAPSIPVRVPVQVNPPNSPFLFSLDLDSFFTRLAISFFYSSIAIAPIVYLLMGGLGSLGGLSIVPFTGKKRRKKRDTFHTVNEMWTKFENLEKEPFTKGSR